MAKCPNKLDRKTAWLICQEKQDNFLRVFEKVFFQVHNWKSYFLIVIRMFRRESWSDKE